AVPTRDQVLLLLVAGLDYTAAAEWLGIPAGQAYLIATGRAADGSGSPAGGESPGDGLLASSQHLANPPQEGQRHPPGSPMVTTTHDPRGGRPRLIAALGGQASEGVMPREFDLVPGVTTIGSDPQADVHLEGLDPHHAEIRRDERDEYVYIKLGAGPPGRVD